MIERHLLPSSLAFIFLAAGLLCSTGVVTAATDIDKNPSPANVYLRYQTSPVILNDSWVNVPSLWLRSDSFVRTQLVGDPILVTKDKTNTFYAEIFFGSYGDLLGDGSLVQVQGSWAVSTPNNLDGSLHVIQLSESGISKINWTSIPGTSSPWIGDFAKTGKPQILVPGFRDMSVIPTQSYLVNFDKTSQSFLKTPVGALTTSHTSFLGTWFNDGVPTVVATTYGSAGRPSDIKDNLPILYSADGSSGVKQTLLGNRMITETSIAFGDFNQDGIQDLVTADTNQQLPNNNWVNDHASYVHYGQSDGNYSPALLLPDPYFKSTKYDGIDSVFLGDLTITNAQVRTHDVAIRVTDLNGDGRMDILISGLVWSNVTPYRILQLLIQQPDGTFKDETDERLFNYDLRGSGAHQVFVEDINGDGFPDLIVVDTTAQVFPDPQENAAANCAMQGNEILINDGEGHFISVMKDSFCKLSANLFGGGWVNNFNPWFNKTTRKLGFVEIAHQPIADGSSQYLYTQAVLKDPLSTGPGFTNPALRGEPGFNEWYYLLHYPDAKAAVDAGSYANGLEYFVAVGKARGDKGHAAMSTTPTTLNLIQGWNLAGNSVNSPLDVTTTLADASKVTSVWKWVPNGAGKWAFYSPSLAGQALSDYAASKGYDVLTTINGGEGFWINANSAFTVQLPAGAVVASTSFQNMSAGWHLIATSDTKTPSGFNTDLSTTPPAAGLVPQNLTSLWTWDKAQSKWYFYAPNLQAQGGTALSDYITSHDYLDFTLANKTLGPGVGFWVNKP